MAFANSNVSDLIATGIDYRADIANNVLGSNPILASLNAKGKVRPVSGGVQIMQPISFAANPNGGAYDGGEVLPTASADVISAAMFDWKQYACPVYITGKEEHQNAGKEQIIDLVQARIENARDTMKNLIEVGLYGDGTGYGGKALTGLGAIAEATATASQTSTLGGISRSTWAFWRSYYATAATAADTAAASVRTSLNTMLAGVSRGSEMPDIVLMGSTVWTRFLYAAQNLQRFTSPSTAATGFESLKYMGADVFLMGGVVGPNGPSYSALTAFALNSRYLHWRPHSKRNFVSGGSRESVNQDAYVKFLLFMGNLTCSGCQFQGRFLSSD
jgi:hypothetical protein